MLFQKLVVKTTRTKFLQNSYKIVSESEINTVALAEH